MRTLNPADWAIGMPGQVYKWAQNLHLAINGSLDQGVPQSQDSSGNFNTFLNGNSNGVLIRVSPSGGTDNKYAWTTSNTQISINHGLVDTSGKPRQPIGVRLESSDKALQIYQPTAPTTSEVFVAPSDATAYATLYIF